MAIFTARCLALVGFCLWTKPAVRRQYSEQMKLFSVRSQTPVTLYCPAGSPHNLSKSCFTDVFLHRSNVLLCRGQFSLRPPDFCGNIAIQYLSHYRSCSWAKFRIFWIWQGDGEESSKANLIKLNTVKAELTVLSGCTEYKVGHINHISWNKCQPLIFHLIN